MSLPPHPTPPSRSPKLALSSSPRDRFEILREIRKVELAGFLELSQTERDSTTNTILTAGAFVVIESVG